MRRAILVGLAACRGGTEALTNCPGEQQPSIADCYVGEFFADCGGSGPPRLACNDQQCLWFAADCGPAGFEASDCPADDICCHDGWPFPAAGYSTALTLDLYAFGPEPWDRTSHVALGVVVDPTLTGTTTQVTCSGPNPNLAAYDPCADPVEVTAFQGGTARVRAWPGEPFRAGWYLWIEIVDDGSGGLGARACAAEMIDTMVCPGAAPLCASAGTITISQLPIVDVRTLVVGVDATFPTGFAVDATLVGEL
jgi:hypothetical protein